MQYTIEIDFEVFKKLTMMRETEQVTYNDVIRKLLGLSQSKQPYKNRNFSKNLTHNNSDDNEDIWVVKGVQFPHGTEFMAEYKGKNIYGRIEAGALIVNGKKYLSPSAAAVAVTGNSVNGWIFWKCRFPGTIGWKEIQSLRKNI
jgi:predicted CopG family antitoxin